jgi:NitT/TauT family transport system permease protein
MKTSARQLAGESRGASRFWDNRPRLGSGLLERLSRAAASDRQIRRTPMAGALQFAIAIVIGLVAWTLIARIISAPLLFPSPRVTGNRFVQLFQDGQITIDIYASLARIVVGFILGSAVGIIVGFLSAGSPVTAAAVNPFLHFFRFVPPIVWFGPALLLFGSGELSKVVLIVYTTFFIVAINTHAGARRVPRDAIRAARSFGAGRPTIFRCIVLPSSIGHIFVGMRIAMGSSFMTIVVAEMLGANVGIGYLITLGGVTVDPSIVFVGVVILGVLGLLTDFVFSLLVRRFGARYLMSVM